MALAPFHTSPRGEHHRLQAIDRSVIGGPRLYLAAGHGAQPMPVRDGLRLAADEWLGGGTLRNSFYVEPWARLTRVRELSLVVEAQGSLRLRVMQASPGHPAQVLKERAIVAAERSRFVLALGSPLDMPASTRLFWHVDAVDGGQLHEAAWCTRLPASPTLRLAVLIRTWNRGDDVRALLARLAEEAAADPFHAQVLARTDFWLLDAGETAEPAAWQALAPLGLNLRAWVGPNLGGGGNAAQLAQLFLDEQAALGEPDDNTEVLILDDDLGIAMETLARYFVFCGYRTTDLVCTLPVLMKSRPTTVWEDGGHWGRSGLQAGVGGDPAGPGGLPRRGFGPSLIRHGLAVDGFEHLDDFGTLNECEYSTFIFFGLPARALRKLGLPAPLFLRGDDIELSLRARAAGIPVFSNPNLAAWHEPGHSYAQEYMAVLHGVLINLSYSANAAQDYARFFEQRMAEHAALDDLDGLALYLSILEDLLDPASPLLGVDFAAHYHAVNRRLGAVAMAAVSETERTGALQRAGAPDGSLQLPFLYPGYHPAGQGTELAPQAGPRGVLLCNVGARTGRRVAPADPLQRLALQRRYLEALSRWHTGFDTLRSHWRERLAATTDPAFWQAVRLKHGAAVREVFRSRCSETTPAAAATLADPSTPVAALDTPELPLAPLQGQQPIRELRDRLERELARWTQMRLSAERSAGGGRAGRRPGRPWWRALWTAPAPLQLPADFDPRAYLELNADVARTGIDPVKHYLSFGQQEGRRYRH